MWRIPTEGVSSNGGEKTGCPYVLGWEYIHHPVQKSTPNA